MSAKSHVIRKREITFSILNRRLCNLPLAMVVGASMKEVFNLSQTGIQGHGKLIKTLQALYDKTEFEAFWSEFNHYLKYAMIVFKREPAVERVIEFVARFVTSQCKKEKEPENKDDVEEDDPISDNPLLLEMFDFLLKSHSAKDRAVRFRSCQLINKLLTNLGEDAQIDDDLYDSLYECMLDRLKDKCPVVRYHAVLAMSRLQDPTDENCPVIKAYLFLLNCDPNPDVRRAVLSSIAPSTKTLASIIGRTRDVKNTVRKVAYEVIAEKVHIKALSIALRLQILNEGLTDREEMVQQACSGKLLQVWLRTFGGNVLDLLKCLDVEDSTDVCSLVLKTLFKGSTVQVLVEKFDILDDRLLIPFDQLTSESALYWQAVCHYVHDMGAEGDVFLEKVLPTCVDYCAYVQRYIDDMKNVTDPEIQLCYEFIIQQLLKIVGYMDLADSASRKAVEGLLHNMLMADHISHRLVKPVVTQICDIKGKTESVVGYFAETVSEIREPITTIERGVSSEEKRQIDIKVASLRVKLNQLREDLDEAVRSQNFTQAAELKGQVAELETEKAELLKSAEVETEEIRTEKNDVQTVLKCQTIISEMLLCVKLNSVNPTLQMMIESQIVPGIQNEDSDVRCMAMNGLGLCCLLSKDLMGTYIPLFMQASQIDVESVRVMALKVLFDLLLIYGLEIGGSEDENQSVEDQQGTGADISMATEESAADKDKTLAASKLVAIICSFLDGDSSELRAHAAEGLCKLLISGRVVSPKILSHLILLWYNPLSEDDTHLRDCLGTFFPLYALATRSNQEVVEEAFLPTLKTLINAPATSPLAEVNVNNVAELLVHLTNTKLLTGNQNLPEMSQDNPGHDNLSEKVCNEVLSKPTSIHLRLWAKILNQMEVSPDNEVVLKDLRILCHKMVKVVKERVCLKSLQKFQSNISQLAKKFIANDDDLDNIEVPSTIEIEEQPEKNETTDDAPKKKRIRGLYSHSVTLGLDSESELELDITQDVTGDIDASSLMSRNPSLPDTPRRRLSKKMSTASVTSEVTAEDDEVFVQPLVPLDKQKINKDEAEQQNVDKEKSVSENISKKDEMEKAEKEEVQTRKSPRQTSPKKLNERPRTSGSPKKYPSKSSPTKFDQEKKKTNIENVEPKTRSPRKRPETKEISTRSPRKKSPKATEQTKRKQTNSDSEQKIKSPRRQSPKVAEQPRKKKSEVELEEPRKKSPRRASPKTADQSKTTKKKSHTELEEPKSKSPRRVSPTPAENSKKKLQSEKNKSPVKSPKKAAVSATSKTLSPRIRDSSRSRVKESTMSAPGATSSRALKRPAEQKTKSPARKMSVKPTEAASSRTASQLKSLPSKLPQATKSKSSSSPSIARKQATTSQSSVSRTARSTSRNRSKAATDSSSSESPVQSTRRKSKSQLIASSTASEGSTGDSSPEPPVKKLLRREPPLAAAKPNKLSRKPATSTEEESEEEALQRRARPSRKSNSAASGSRVTEVTSETRTTRSSPRTAASGNVRIISGRPKPDSQKSSALAADLIKKQKASVSRNMKEAASPASRSSSQPSKPRSPAPAPGVKSASKGEHSNAPASKGGKSKSPDADQENRKPPRMNTRGSQSPATPRAESPRKTDSTVAASNIEKRGKITPANAGKGKLGIQAAAGRGSVSKGSEVKKTPRSRIVESDGDSDLFASPVSESRTTRSVLKSGSASRMTVKATRGKALEETKQNLEKKLGETTPQTRSTRSTPQQKTTGARSLRGKP